MWSKAKLGLRATFEGKDPLAIIAAAHELGWAPPVEDGLLDIDGVELEDRESLKRMLARAKRSIGVYFGDYPRQIAVTSLKDPTIVRVGNTGVVVDMAKLANQLTAVPFELASFANMHMKKFNDKLPGDPRVSPGAMHDKLGWALAFRGRGHDRLVSKRWLATGPWKLWTDGDVSVVQLHALDADLPTALKQAAPGYAKLDIDGAATGLIDPDKTYESTTTGTRVEVTAAPPADVLLARAATRTPVAFVFPSQQAALAALPRIWPYGHEVWVKDKRLVYSAPDVTPAWAR